MAGFSIVMLQLFFLYLIIACLATLWGIAAYVMTSLSVHTIAKRRNISKPWLAWIPVANVWTLGSLSDQYRYVTQGKITNKRKVLLGLYIAVIGLLLLMMIPYVFIIMLAVGNVDSVMTDAQITQMMICAVGVLVLCLAMIAVAIVYMVFLYIALYDVFRSCDPKNATLYLVLTILLGVVFPFFMLACRKKDLGMPERKNVDSAVEPLE